MALVRIGPLSAGPLVDRLVSDPELLPLVRRLEPAGLGSVIERVGLEDAGVLISLCSAEQLERVFDRDLWANAEPGEVERFDGARFGLWLEVMAEAGDERLVRWLVELAIDLVTLGIHRLVLVLDMDALVAEATMAGDEFATIEKALESCAYQEWEEFRVIARDASRFDMVWSALVALDRDHHELLRSILESCAAMSADVIDEQGLYQVLTAAESLADDVAGEREDRLAQRGFVPPADARAFLALARDGLGEPGRRDAITTRYFRHRVVTPAAAVAADALGDLLRDAGVIAPPAPALTAGAPPAYGFLLETLAALAEIDPDAHDHRREEITYLANVLAAGHRGRDDRLRPVEALELAFEVCGVGLRDAGGDALEQLRRTPADLLFRAAWPRFAGGLDPAAIKR